MKGVRYLFTGMGFLGFCVIYFLRVSINVAIVAMVNATAVYDPKGILKTDECAVAKNLTANADDPKGEFIWSPMIQNFIMGSFYVGYCLTQIPGGRLSELYSAKWVFGLGTLLSSLLALAVPLAAKLHVFMLIFIRVLDGLSQGVTMPAIHSMLGQWLPETEKGLLATIVYAGINMGTIVGMPIAGILCKQELFGGWPSVFYIFGICGCIWFLLWIMLVTDKPCNHPWITSGELKYITDNQDLQRLQSLPDIPWMSIMKSVPFLALVVTQFGQDWCFYTYLTNLPTFMDNILHFKLDTTGYLAALPYLLQGFVGGIVAAVTDAFMRRDYCSKEFIRKFCNTASSVATALGLLGVCLSGCNVNMTVAMFTVSISLGGFCYCGYMLSHLDLSPEYAGTLMGVANTVSNLSGFIAPAVVGALTENHQTLRQWHIVFYISITIVLASGLIFLAFVTTKKQDWVAMAARALLDEDEDTVPVRYGTLEMSSQFEEQY